MFTGLVEGRGTVRDIRREGAAIRLVLEAPDGISGGCQIGDSIAINGCCLTVVEVDGARWAFEAGSETLSRTNLGDLAVGHPVNLERSLPVDARLGGHFVQGHVDGQGIVDRIDRDGEWITMWFRVDPALSAQMVSKGSVAVDGVSLTLVDVEEQRFSIALIPHTLEVTTLGVRGQGDRVNIETDILGKYVQKFLTGVDGRLTDVAPGRANALLDKPAVAPGKPRVAPGSPDALAGPPPAAANASEQTASDRRAPDFDDAD